MKKTEIYFETVICCSVRWVVYAAEAFTVRILCCLRQRLPDAKEFIDNSRPIRTVQMAKRHSGADFYKKYLLNGSPQMYFCV